MKVVVLVLRFCSASRYRVELLLERPFHSRWSPPVTFIILLGARATSTCQRIASTIDGSWRLARGGEMAFRSRAAPEPVADTPERLFPLLTRTNENSDGLWSQQTDILRDYMQHVRTRDLAVELPTGTGKTLPGLLIADWRRRRNRARSVFACPTVQLVRQVVRAAAREGIPVVDLSGPWRGWDPVASHRYESAAATAIVTYSAIFNVNPHITTPDVLLFDDAHAADQYVSGAYTVTIPRRDLPTVYEDLVEAIRPGLSDERRGQLAMLTPGPGARAHVDLVFPALLDLAEPIDHALVKLDGLDTPAGRQQSFRYSAIRGHLASCHVYVSWDRIEIRPPIAPTAENATFAGAAQRIYLSATLGAAGELERAFSRPRITRLRLPPEAAKPRSGRRFVVFPWLVSDAEPAELTKQLLRQSDRAIVLTPSEWAATAAARSIVPDGWSTMGRDEVVDSFDVFAKAKDVACVLANRYDGIDLPGEACRVVALFGLPRATTLHEEFLATRARATAALEERLRARVVQGTGRCTRGPRDFAMVVVADPETTNYLSRPEVQRSLMKTCRRRSSLVSTSRRRRPPSCSRTSGCSSIANRDGRTAPSRSSPSSAPIAASSLPRNR